MKLLFYIILLLFVPVVVFAQKFSYIHYDTKDGLAGSTIYDMCQDKDGFMWFATENGLSRFDGMVFKNFTVKDGLPDNEVLKMYADSKDRVWISSFSKEICYYYHGKVFNKANCNVIKKMHAKNFATTFAEDDNGTVAIGAANSVIMISSEDSVREFEASAILGKTESLEVVSFNGKIVVSFITGMRYSYNLNNTFTLLNKFTEKVINPNYKNYMFPTLSDRFGSVLKRLRLKADMISYENDNAYSTFINSSDGAWSIDTVNNQWSEHFLPGKKISRSIKDYEGHLWFSTLGEGVYKLPSKEIKTISYSDKKDNSEVFSILRNDAAIIGGMGFSKAIKVFSNGNISTIDYEKKLSLSGSTGINNRLYTSKELSSGVVLLGFDAFLVKNESGKALFNYIFPVKSIEEIDAHTILVGTGNYVFKMRLKDLQIIDTIWRGRCTKVFYNQHKYYVGTINGLYQVNDNKTYKYLGEIYPSLSRRITDIKCTVDNTLWIATSDEGIVAYKDGRVIHVIKDTNGLSSNICKTLFWDHNFLWVGTNKGLNKIDLRKNNYPVTKFSSSDGLPSDIINAIYVKDSLIWVGTPAGLTYFNENKISATSICSIQLLSVNIGGRAQKIDTIYDVAYKNNSINFEYVAISFKSGGDIVYHYKLKGLDNEWKETRQGNLNYQSLPPGDYKLELYGVNKFNVQSKIIKIQFSIAYPFWKTWWFYFLILLLVIWLTWLIVNRRNQKIRASFEEKNLTQQQFAVLEQQAMQAQMNPHFIFNCLNSIQQYILTNDKEKANQYLTRFASLIRQTLDNSGKKTITVAEEVRYLSTYLEMEKMRFGDNFNYIIVTDETVKADYIEMPAMLLQPYVENCLRHGIRYKEAGLGKVEILFSIKDDVLNCDIRDNGIGRKKAAELKSRQHIEYQSRGMNLTEKRIELLNKINENVITVKVIDLKDAEGKDCGTEVILNIPV